MFALFAVLGILLGGAQFIDSTANKVVIYVPDTIRSGLITQYRNALPNAKLVTIYAKSGSKTFDLYAKAFRQIESRGIYTAHRPNSQYLGAYQISRTNLHQLGIDVPDEVYLHNKELQDTAFSRLVRRTYKENKLLFDMYEDKVLSVYHLTISGLIAMCHSVGPAQLRVFLKSNGAIVPTDGNNVPATRYLTLGNYELF